MNQILEIELVIPIPSDSILVKQENMRICQKTA